MCSMKLNDTQVLVFPLDPEVCRGFIQTAKALGANVLGASSAMKNAADYSVDNFVTLPFITEAVFESSFRRVLETYAISHVYAPHIGVWLYLKELLDDSSKESSFVLCEPNPFTADWNEFEPSFKWARKLLSEEIVEYLDLGTNCSVSNRLSIGKCAGLHKQFVQVPGQCDDNKLSMLTHIMRVVPDGDLVEIGSYFGRSAFALGWLAQEHSVGSLVCVDPWNKQKIESQGEKAAILNNRSILDRELEDKNKEPSIKNSDFDDKIFNGFVASVSMLKNTGYLRDISSSAVATYEKAAYKKALDCEQLGKIPLVGHISLLHIDGNHGYEFVKQDIECWSSWVISGGWILLDDYVWAFGDGPKIAGDEFLEKGEFDIAFTASDTLFLRKK